ncbi:MAG: ATP-binding protein [Opitutaceae bacterium]|jgi:PAS domain S-box-containing protein
MNASLQHEETTQVTLRNSEIRYRRLFEAAQDGILILDAKTSRIDDANPFVLNMLGYGLDEILGKQLWEIGFFRDRELSEEAFEKLQKEGYIRYENLPLKTKDGRPHEVEFVSNIYEVDRQKVIQCNIRDITDRKLLEAKLQQSQKMQVVGQLAGGMAHDFNNILTSMLLHLSLLQDDPSLWEGMRDSLRQLECEAKRAAGLTKQLLLFSRQQIIGLKPVNLNEVLEHLLTMLRRLLSKDVNLEFHAGDKPLWIEADRTMIEQVVTNLCLNARDAMAPTGGRLTIDAKFVELGTEAFRLNPEARAGLFVCLSVTDTGSGMDEATVMHLFEPFFTTKEVGKGTGLGLSTVFGITKQHRGWVEVESQVGKGSIFRVYLPAMTKALSIESSPVVLRAKGGKETILVVEDDAVVRNMIALGLQMQGYNILEAANGPEAIQVWDRYAGTIDLLFADMRMPLGMTGIELYERFKRTNENLKVVISSGYCEQNAKSPDLIDPVIVFLPKPYDIQMLAGTVRSCLDQACPHRASNPAVLAAPFATITDLDGTDSIASFSRHT